MKVKKEQRWRSAITGLFVKASYALKHPRTTYQDTMKKVKKNGSK